VGRCGLDATDSGQGPVADSSEPGNEPSGTIKGKKFLNQLSDQLLKQDPVPGISF